MFKPPPPGLRPMSDFDPSEPAILHDRLSDTIEPWTGEEADDYRKHSIVHADGAVEWGGFMFDGWGNVLRRMSPCLLRKNARGMKGGRVCGSRIPLSAGTVRNNLAG